MEKMLDYPITGGILNGYKTKKELFLNDNISRLALITLKKEVKAPGAISKLFAVALTKTKLNRTDTRETLDDCGTKRHVTIKIKDKKDLLMYRYKYYEGKNGKYDKFIDKNDTFLIGKTLHIRSLTTCDGGDIKCKKCYGANAKFAVDNKVFKVNVNDYTVVKVAGILQGIISIKHYLGGILMETKVEYNGLEYSLEEFIKKMPFITDIDYNVINFVPGTQIDFVKEFEDDNTESLFVDGIKINYKFEIKKMNDYSYKFTIPNDSVKRRAGNLTKAISKHRVKDRKTGLPDFDSSLYFNLPVDEQLAAIVDYLRDNIDLDHFIHYEIIASSMTRDYDNVNQSVTADTKHVRFIQTGDMTIYPGRNKSMALTLPYGYVKDAIKTVYTEIQPEEYDLLYSNLLNKNPDTDTTYRKMNKILRDAIEENDKYFNKTDEGIIG